MSEFPRSQAAIAGIGCTEFSKDSGVSTFALAARAVKAAVADAGLELSDVDGLARSAPTTRSRRTCSRRRSASRA